MNVFDYFLTDSKSLDKDLILGRAETASYQEIFGKSLALAAKIRKEIGENKNVLVLFPNSSWFIITYLAIFKSGNVCVPLNTDIEQKNLDYIIDQCKPAVAFISKRLKPKLNLDGITLYDEDCLMALSSQGRDRFAEETNFDDKRLAEIIFTSGSTGEPKGVMLSHRNLIANTRSILEYLNLTSEDTIEIVLPFYYCYGLSLLHTHLRVGGSVVLNNTFIFLGSVLDDLNKYKCTGFSGVPSHFQLLLRNSTSFKTMDLPYLRYVTQAGGKLHDVFIEEFREAFPDVVFYVMYGQTEATARLSYLPPEFLPEKLGSMGKGIPGVELDIFNDKGQPAGVGEVGEIVARGDNIMSGYLNDEELTAKTLKNGWLHTGDLAQKDEDGFFFITARTKEIIKVGGNRVSPKEVESVILTLPEVVDCTITGEFDEMLGELLKAEITLVPKTDKDLAKEEILKKCASELISYKVPQKIEFLDRVNIAATGKKVK
ncbi:MAG: AMP-dependent synthetase [Bacteroides sp. SM23_62]|nr:MAG: AMP-dependent synthetase [Bacteroides sp. SM23_62]